MSFEIKTAERSGSRLLIQISGVSGSGKTYTALQLAFGLAGGDASKIVGIDTENRRMSLNADILPGGAKFRMIEFYPPFSPARYIEAIEAAIKAGAEVIVIDSVSHEWEGPGGCQEIADRTRPKLPDWKTAKAEHKRFVTYMLQAPAHIIACTRAREKTDFKDPRNPVSLGIQPIQEANFSFEATVSLMMHDQGRLQDVLKCPADLQAVMGRGKGYITADDGKALRGWVDGAKPVDAELETHRGNIQNVCEKGLDALEKAWTALPKGVPGRLGKAFLDQCKASAIAYDKARDAAATAEAGEGEQSEALAGLNAAAAAVATAPKPAPGSTADVQPPVSFTTSAEPAASTAADGDIF